MTREEAISEIKSWAFIEGKKAEAIHTLIPELAETEDEHVRKWLITLLQNNYKGNYWATQAIAYLEKQKEQKSQGGSSEIPNNQWSEEDKRMLDDIDESLFMYEAGQNDYTQEQVERERKWLKSLLERFK